jgi:glucose-6-phosphate isomerase
MQLPDEAVSYEYQGSLAPAQEAWTPAAEARGRHFLTAARLKELQPRLLQVRSQVVAEREMQQAPPELQPLEAGFIDLPQKTLDAYRRYGETSELGRVIRHAGWLREQADRVVVLGSGGSVLGARALIEALGACHHNELPPEKRLGTPRLYFEGNGIDNDAFQDLLDLLENTCVDPELREERWGVIVVSKSGDTLETAAAHRVLSRSAAEYYGSRSPRLRQLFVPVTGTTGRLRELCQADGYSDGDILTIPDSVGSRFAVLTPAGLLPAAVMGLDVRALLLGAAAMTRRFLEEPFDRNPVLQYAAVNTLLAEEQDKPIRVVAVWSKKLETVAHWYGLLVAESLGRRGRGPTPITAVHTRDLAARAQQHHDGPRDKVIINLSVRQPTQAPILIGMADRNEDELNSLNRTGWPDLSDAALRAANLAYFEAARPTAELIVPTLSEHTMGQLLQMLMLATVVEARLMGVNPYAQPSAPGWKNNWRAELKSGHADV